MHDVYCGGGLPERRYEYVQLSPCSREVYITFHTRAQKHTHTHTHTHVLPIMSPSSSMWLPPPPAVTRIGGVTWKLAYTSKRTPLESIELQCAYDCGVVSDARLTFRDDTKRPDLPGPLWFRHAEFCFLRTTLKAALNPETRCYRADKKFGDRHVYVGRVKRKSGCAIQLGFAYEGVRLIRELDPSTATRISQDLMHMNTLVLESQTSEQHRWKSAKIFSALAILRAIEPDTNKWPQLARQPDVLERNVRSVYVNRRAELCAEAARVCDAYNISRSFVDEFFTDVGLGIDVLREIIGNSKIIEQEYFTKLFAK
jgi:hypothetical protein